MPTNLRHHRIHQFQPFPTTSATSHHLENIHHPAIAPYVDLAPNAIVPHQGDMTNVQSPFLGVLVVEDRQEDSIAPHDLDPLPGILLLHDVNYANQAEERPSLCAPLLHTVEKDDIVDKITNHQVNHPSHQLLFNLHRGNTAHTNHHPTPTMIQHQPSSNTNTHTHSYHYDHSSTDKWQSWGQWKDYSKSSESSNQSKWIDYSKSAHSYHTPHESSTKPLTAFSSDHTSSYHKQNQPAKSGNEQPPAPVNVPPGHMAITLQEGSKEEWYRGVAFALRHPDRMRAANEVAPEDKPQPSQSMDITDYDRAVETLRKVDSRIPSDVIKKAIQLLFSTYLLPDYDLRKAYILDLPSTNMLALIFPLPESSHYQMPPPFHKHHNHTWALLHGTTLRTSQLILLEGKIRPANWSYHKNLQRCDMPTFGAFYLGREVSNSDKTFPDWAAKELLDTIQKKGKGQQDVVIGAMYRGARQHTAFKAGGNEMAQLSVADKGIATTSEKYTIAHSNHVGLKFVALKWQNLTDKIEVGDSSSED